MKPSLLLFLLILSSGCSDHPAGKEIPVDAHAVNPESGIVIETYNNLLEGISTRHPARVNERIHPQHGLFIIESPGAMPAMTHVFNIAQWKNSDGKSFFDMGKPGTALPVKEELLPVIDCNFPPWFYSKDGCFLQKVNTINSSGIWDYSNLSDTEKQKAKEVAGKVEWTVINTRSFKCYFAIIEEKVYLLFIDFRRPCEA